MRARRLIWIVVASVVVAAGLAVAARTAWPQAGISDDRDALAHLDLPRFSGDVERVRVRTAGGADVPVRIRGGGLWPVHQLRSGQRLTVELTVRRPSYAGWLVGDTETARFTVVTPTAHLRGRWLQVERGELVTVAYDQPIHLVWLGPGHGIYRLEHPGPIVPIGKRAKGSDTVGSVVIAAAARSWEHLSEPVRVTWFPAKPYPQALVTPRPGEQLSPAQPLKLTFSSTVKNVLGAKLPSVDTPGKWRTLDDHTLAFRPSGPGFALDSSVTVRLPRAVHTVGSAGASLTSTLQWDVPRGSTTRMEQLLAEQGYLPLDWRPAGDPVARTLAAQLSAAVDPPDGSFAWRFSNTPPELTRLWKEGDWNEIVRGAVMMFQDDHELDVDAIPGPIFWRTLLADAIAGKRRDEGYSYVFVHRATPQSLNLWHNGQVILSSPGNTGVPQAPTELGTFPVFEHIPIG